MSKAGIGRRGLKRALVLGAVMAFGVVSLTVTTAGQGEMVVEVERIKDNLYVLRGGGGNSPHSSRATAWCWSTRSSRAGGSR